MTEECTTPLGADGDWDLHCERHLKKEKELREQLEEWRKGWRYENQKKLQYVKQAGEYRDAMNRALADVERLKNQAFFQDERERCALAAEAWVKAHPYSCDDLPGLLAAIRGVVTGARPPGEHQPPVPPSAG